MRIFYLVEFHDIDKLSVPLYNIYTVVVFHESTRGGNKNDCHFHRTLNDMRAGVD